MTMIQIKRVYEPAAKEDGARLFVERLWLKMPNAPKR